MAHRAILPSLHEKAGPFAALPLYERGAGFDQLFPTLRNHGEG